MIDRLTSFFLTVTLLAGISVPAEKSPDRDTLRRSRRTVEPADHGRALVNPQMGWTMHFCSNIIKNEQGGIVAAFCDESFNVRDLPVGPPGEAPTRNIRSIFAVALKVYGFAPNTQPGTYDLYVSVGMRDGTPTIALPHENNDGHRRYKLGTIDLLPTDS